MLGGRWIGGSKKEGPEPREDRVGVGEVSRTRPKELISLGLGCPPEMETQKRPQRGTSAEASFKEPRMLKLDFILRALGSHGRVLSKGGTWIQKYPFGCCVGVEVQRGGWGRNPGGKGLSLESGGDQGGGGPGWGAAPIPLSLLSCRLAPAPSPGVVPG